MTRSPASLTVAAAQLRARPLGQAADALADIDAAIRAAAERRIELLVLPECSYPAYLLGSSAAYRGCGGLPSATLREWLSRQASAAGLHVVCGFVEEDGEALYNAAVLIAPNGRAIGVHRKLFMWGADADYFRPGAAIRPFDTPIGRIGIVICADARSPEIVAALAQQHVDLIAMPTCWVNFDDGAGGYSNPQPEFLIPARAREFDVPFVCANKHGAETAGVGYCGRSMIVLADGSVAAEAPRDGDALVTAIVALHRGSRTKRSPTGLERIIATDPPESPPVHDDGRVELAVVPAALLAAAAPTELLGALADAGCELLISRAERHEWCEQLTVTGRSYGITVAAWPTPQRVVYDQYGPYAWLTGAETASFVPARGMALEGAALLLVADPPADERLLRTRALENRVFVVAIGQRSASVIGPDGRILGRCADGEVPLTLTIDLNQAADKEVFSRTNIWEQRRAEVLAATLARPSPATTANRARV